MWRGKFYSADKIENYSLKHSISALKKRGEEPGYGGDLKQGPGS